MGSYGIGISRLMGTIVEVFNDKNGIIWPESVAPYKVHLLEFSGSSAKELHEDLQAKNIEVLYDDRDFSPGEKLVEADLIGIPTRAIVSPKNEEKIEVKKRDEAEALIMDKKEFMNMISESQT